LLSYLTLWLVVDPGWFGISLGDACCKSYYC
jgi:hypothetical protein